MAIAQTETKSYQSATLRDWIRPHNAVNGVVTFTGPAPTLNADQATAMVCLELMYAKGNAGQKAAAAHLGREVAAGRMGCADLRAMAEGRHEWRVGKGRAAVMGMSDAALNLPDGPGLNPKVKAALDAERARRAGKPVPAAAVGFTPAPPPSSGMTAAQRSDVLAKMAGYTDAELASVVKFNSDPEMRSLAKIMQQTNASIARRTTGAKTAGAPSDPAADWDAGRVDRSAWISRDVYLKAMSALGR